MDNIALHLSGLTTPDRADRARKAFDLYRTEHGGLLQDLVADLMHLAEVDECPGGAVTVVKWAVIAFLAEQPSWPTEESAGGEHYVGQAGMADDWVSVECGEDPREVAHEMVPLMLHAGFYSCDMAGHIDDLIKGHILTAETGIAFRIIKSEL
ncbi:hypothetical protein GCM10009678_51130 [Actinomadura kijaniata]|uniref:hypothetical protein n=1 Tax=Actinomycetes TaxID=1760 RepID=UPI002FED0123